jgi:hypothetical protein
MPAGDSQIIQALPVNEQDLGADTQIGTEDDLTIVEE